MTTPLYYPRAGSVGQRALEYLSEKREDTLGADLADAIDCDSDSLYASLNLCVQHGLITRWTGIDGRARYRVGPQAPITGPDPLAAALSGNAKTMTEAETTEVGSAVTAVLGENTDYEIPVVSEKTLSIADPDTSEVPVVTTESELKVDGGESRHFEFGLFTDGRLVLEVGQKLTILKREETVKLFDWATKINSLGDLP